MPQYLTRHIEKDNPERSKAWLFSINELKLMESALSMSIEELGDDNGEKTELRNDLRMCIDGLL